MCWEILSDVGWKMFESDNPKKGDLKLVNALVLWTIFIASGAFKKSKKRCYLIELVKFP